MARDNQRQGSGQEVATVQPPRLPMPAEAAKEGISAGQWKALTDAVFPSAKTVDGVMLAINYCHSRKLDVFKRVVHVVPMWNSALNREVETVWPGIGEMRTTAHRTGMHAGNDDCVFGRVMKQAFKVSVTKSKRGGEPYTQSAQCAMFEFPEWAQITVYRIVAGQRVPFVGPKVRFMETFSGEKGLRVPNSRWQQAPWQMLEKCAEAAALRRAFPEELGDQWSAEEMEGKETVGGIPTVDAVYTTVDDAEPQAGATGEQDAGEPDLNGWDAAELGEYVDYLRAGFLTCDTPGKVDHALDREAKRIDTLPQAERELAESYIAEARARTAPKDTPKADPPAEKAAADSPAPEARQEPEPQTQAKPGQSRSAPTYFRTLRMKVEEAETMEELERIEAAETRLIQQEDANTQSMCWLLIGERRSELRDDIADA